MAVLTYKCPNCGGEVTFDPAKQNFRCDYCISQFTEEELQAASVQTTMNRIARFIVVSFLFITSKQ